MTFLGHLLLRDMRAKNIFLPLCASLLFYAAGEPVYIFLMLLSIAMNYAFGRLIASKRARFFLALSVFATFCCWRCSNMRTCSLKRWT